MNFLDFNWKITYQDNKYYLEATNSQETIVMCKVIDRYYDIDDDELIVYKKELLTQLKGML